MAHNPANLDALIRREDFVVAIDPKNIQAVEEAPKLKIQELENDSFMFRKLRKPDFQRTTAHWSPEKISAFIKSFASGDLIPAVILWQSPTSGNVFVIDGAHRLSALIAWVHDDYGDKIRSQQFFGDLSPQRKSIAEETRNLIATGVGSYVELKHSINPSAERNRYSANLAAGGVTLQWVRGDAASAERSFHAINTEQTPIGTLEVRLIRDRRCPNAISARALVQAGTGQFYYSSFPDQNQQQIKKIANDIYEDLFVPELETPIKTLDLPVAGKGYSADSLELILDVVEFVNKRDPTQQAKSVRVKRDILAPTMEVDTDGSRTIDFLKKLRAAASRIAGMRPESLGLHPAVYFYSATGNYQPTAFLAAISFTQEMESKRELLAFTRHRHDFEELLLKYKHFINQIGKQYGSGTRGLTALTKLYRYLFDGLLANLSEIEIVPQIVADERLKFLAPIVDPDKGVKKNFTSERKSAVFLRKAIDTAPRCGICNARVHRASITIDHIQRKEDGGDGGEDNGQLTHPFCNSTFKN